jgi:hypothetical protein
MSETDDQTPPLNREQRRARKFGRAAKDNPAVPGGTATTGAATTGEAGEAYAGRPDQDQVRTVGAGAGGAVESDDRLRHHEGMNPPQNQPNS